MLLLNNLLFAVMLSVLMLSSTVRSTETIGYEALTQSVVDFVRYRSHPTKVTILLKCWKSYEINHFRKILSKHDILSVSERKKGEEEEEEQEREREKEFDMFVMDFDCYNAEELQILQINDLWEFPQRWFIFLTSLEAFPTSLPLWINTRVYLLQKTSPHILTSPYRILDSSNSSLSSSFNYSYNFLGTWSVKDMNYTTLGDVSDYQHRSNHHGLAINSTVVLVYQRTLQHLEDGRFLLEDTLTKHNYPLLMYLMDIMNATLRIKWVPGWGTQLPNTTAYNMMWGDLQTGQSDIGGTSGFITDDRIPWADYIACPTPTLVVFILKKPPLSVVSNILTKPFEWHVWGSLGVLVLVIFCVTWITMKLEWKHFNWNIGERHLLRANAMDVVQFEIGAICQQGLEAEPRSLAGRMITFCTLLSFLFVYTSYSACIVGLLQSTSNTVTTMEDLLRTNIRLGAENTPYMKFFFLKQRGKTKELIYNQKIAPPYEPEHYLPVAEGVEHMRTEFYAFHAERDTIYKQISKTYTEHEKCGLLEIKFLSEVEPYMVIKKKLPYKEIITIAYRKFKEFGLAKRVERIVYTPKPKCNRSYGTFRSVGINDAYFGVLCYVIGICAAVILLILERIVKRYSCFKMFKMHLFYRK